MTTAGRLLALTVLVVLSCIPVTEAVTTEPPEDAAVLKLGHCTLWTDPSGTGGINSDCDFGTAPPTPPGMPPPPMSPPPATPCTAATFTVAGGGVTWHNYGPVADGSVMTLALHAERYFLGVFPEFAGLHHIGLPTTTEFAPQPSSTQTYTITLTVTSPGWAYVFWAGGGVPGNGGFPPNGSPAHSSTYQDMTGWEVLYPRGGGCDNPPFTGSNRCFQAVPEGTTTMDGSTGAYGFFLVARKNFETAQTITFDMTNTPNGQYRANAQKFMGGFFGAPCS